MITIEEILKSRIKYFIMSKSLKSNFNELFYKINIVRYFWNKPMIVNSGYRSPRYNKKIGGSANSHHCYCRAIDISDPNHELYDWLVSGAGKVLSEKLGLYFEDKYYTKTWCHIQTRPPKSGGRVFKP